MIKAAEEEAVQEKRVVAVLVIRDILESVLANQYLFRPLLLQKAEDVDDEFLKEFAIRGLRSALEIIIASLNPESIQENFPNLCGSDWEKLFVFPTVRDSLTNCLGTSGVQMGWLASQADMLADDWEVMK